MILAFEAWACRMKADRSGGANRAEYLAAVLEDHARCVPFERVTERIIVGDKEPGVAAALDHFPRRADRERAGVEHPLHGIGRAELAVEIGGAR